MPHLAGIRIEQYRCFDTLTVDGFSRVNVIVGANNSGKTALLEAVELVAADASPARLASSLTRRGQYFADASPDVGAARDTDALLDAWELRRGREPIQNQQPLFRLFAVGDEQPRVAVESRHEQGVFSLLLAGRGKARRIPLVGRRGVSGAGLDAGRSMGAPDPQNVVYVGSQLTPAGMMKRGWAAIAGNSTEDFVVEALKCIDPTIEKVIFAPTLQTPSGYEGWYLRTTQSKSRLALSGFGEGLKRSLALAFALATASGGTLLVDEIENGLHYSTMPQLWRFLVATARQLDVQVFVTSHSKDWLESLADLHREQPQLAADVTVHRLVQGQATSTRFTAERIAELEDLDLESR